MNRLNTLIGRLPTNNPLKTKHVLSSALSDEC